MMALEFLRSAQRESDEPALALEKVAAVLFHLAVQVAESVVIVTGGGTVGGGVRSGGVRDEVDAIKHSSKSSIIMVLERIQNSTGQGQ